jgi:DNA-binding Xre family transcriptional regulator
MFVSLIPNLMKLKKWSAKELERQTGLSWQVAFDLSHGNIPGTTNTLLKLCVAFNCQPNDLIVFKESE